MSLLKKVIFLLSVLFLMACHKLEKGVVVKKFVTEPHTTFVYSGKTYVPIYYPKIWHVKIKGEYKGKDRTETYVVTEDYYKQVKVGDVFYNPKIFRGEVDTKYD